MTLCEVFAVDALSMVRGALPARDGTKAILHEAAKARTDLFRLPPGDRLANHYHSKIWDLFVPVSGFGQIAHERSGDIGRTDLKPGVFCAMPPGVRHEVRNLSDQHDFVYLLIHAPGDGYDHIPTPLHPAFEET